MAKEKTAAPKAKPAMTKSAFFQAIAEETGMKKAEVVQMYDCMQGIVIKQLGPKGPGVVTLPNICKLTVTHTKADKGGKLKPNPFKPGEMMVTKPKPARTKVKARGLKLFLESIAKK